MLHLPFSFLKIWNMVVITMLMSLPANSVVHISGSVSID